MTTFDELLSTCANMSTFSVNDLNGDNIQDEIDTFCKTLGQNRNLQQT